MAKHLIKGYITSTTNVLGDAPDIGFSMYKPSAQYSPETVVVAEHEIEVEVPDSFDPRPAMVAALEEQKRLAQAEFSRTVMAIDWQIQSLLAIEHVAEVD
jgi:hypothetical protein